MNIGDMTMSEIVDYYGLADERRSDRRHQALLKQDPAYHDACLLARIDERLNQLTQDQLVESIWESVLPDITAAYRTEDALQMGRIILNVISRYWRPILSGRIQEAGDL